MPFQCVRAAYRQFRMAPMVVRTVFYLLHVPSIVRNEQYKALDFFLLMKQFHTPNFIPKMSYPDIFPFVFLAAVNEFERDGLTVSS